MHFTDTHLAVKNILESGENLPDSERRQGREHRQGLAQGSGALGVPNIFPARAKDTAPPKINARLQAL
jgi:hypothetical protein